jgi:cobalt-zinc-cadmium efflux system outer membrane protein
MVGMRHRGWVLTAALLGGCTTVTVPSGFVPGGRGAADTLLPAGLTTTITQTPPPPRGNSFELPPNLPGSEKLAGTPLPEKSQFPTLPPVSTLSTQSGDALSLAKLQEMAFTGNPALRKANADADAAYGAMIQAGLHPNPTVGYQADQMQPWLSPRGTTGQQGAYINQLIKTAGKLGLAQQVAGYDYLNAVVAARQMHLEVMAQVRSNYFGILVAQQSVEIHRSLITLADEVYDLQRKQVKAGEAAAYEPLQLFAQAAQARNNLAQAEQSAQAAWRQLAASLGQPALKRQPLTGQADIEPPAFDFVALEQSLSEHTEVLAARNRELQAEANLRLQQVTPIPDVSTNVIVQYDNSLGTSQFGVQLGVSLPLYDRNQGAIRQAQANLMGAAEAIQATQNELTGKLAEARGRFETHRTLASNYRTLVLPNLSQAYRAMIRRYQVEPEAVKFNDIVVAQQNLAQAMQAYLNSLESQWKAVVDLAALGQVDELYPAKP